MRTQLVDSLLADLLQDARFVCVCIASKHASNFFAFTDFDPLLSFVVFRVLTSNFESIV